jgi:hypothetical protein
MMLKEEIKKELEKINEDSQKQKELTNDQVEILLLASLLEEA